MNSVVTAHGLDETRLARLTHAIESDITAGMYLGAVVLVAHEGKIVLQQAVGFSDSTIEKKMKPDSIFATFSLAKHFTNAAILQQIDAGRIAFTTQVRDVIPEYGTRGKESTTIADLLLHRAGLPFDPPALAPELLGDIKAVTDYACALEPVTAPGSAVSYSAMIAHSVLAEIVTRIDGKGRSFRKILEQELFTPLGMGNTSLGMRPDLANRQVPVIAHDPQPGMLELKHLEAMAGALVEGVEVPAAGAFSTAHDLFRFAEAFRRNGKLDGQRVLSPAMVSAATRNLTGSQPNGMWNYTRQMRGWPDIPAYLGLGFYLRGEGLFPHAFGQLACASTFGGIGAGSNCFWVDPCKQITYVFLSAGLIEESASWERHQRYSDLVHSAFQ
jgi:CubicO group peptidase (beta-lactamase class C family)